MIIIILILSAMANLALTAIILWLLPGKGKKSHRNFTCTATAGRCKTQCLDCHLYADGGYKNEPF